MMQKKLKEFIGNPHQPTLALQWRRFWRVLPLKEGSSSFQKNEKLSLFFSIHAAIFFKYDKKYDRLCMTMQYMLDMLPNLLQYEGECAKTY